MCGKEMKGMNFKLMRLGYFLGGLFIFLKEKVFGGGMDGGLEVLDREILVRVWREVLYIYILVFEFLFWLVME